MCRGSPPLRPTWLMRNGKKVADRLLSRTCGLLGDSCRPPEPSGRDADETLEVMRERALVRKPGVGGDLCQGEVAAALQELLCPFDAARDHVLMRRHPCGRLELPGEVVGAEPGDRGHFLQSRAGVEVLLDVLDDGTEPPPWQRAVSPALRPAGCLDMSDQVDG